MDWIEDVGMNDNEYHCDECYCITNRIYDSREEVRRGALEHFAEEPNEWFAAMRPKAKTMVVIPYVDCSHDDEVSLQAAELPIEYCPYCGRKL